MITYLNPFTITMVFRRHEDMVGFLKCICKKQLNSLFANGRKNTFLHYFKEEKEVFMQ